jgi:acyl-CoA thioester hydrolase
MKIELPTNLKPVHSMVVQMRWGDMDVMGHINNTLYFRYMEMARLQWFGELGMPANPQGQGPVIANAFCNFLRQLEYPGDVVVTTFVGAMGRSSVDTFHEMRRADDPHTLYANGGATVVWVDFPAQKSMPIPPDMRQLLG